jgi:type I restriction enzyme S subunit
MGSEWNLVRLADCAVFQEGYVNPSQKKSDYFDGPIKWLRAVDLNDGFVYDTTRTLSNEGFNSAGKSALLFKPGTLAISKSGTIGRVGILKDYMCGNRAVINITVDESKCDNRFIFYVLKKNREFFEMMATGSVQKNLYTSVLGSLEFLLPPKVIQENIGNLLGSLDNKIALNRQINTTLESMAQALFKSWFVDFDPVIDNALAAGNEIPDAFQKRASARAARREALRQQTNKIANETIGATDADSPEQALPDTGLSDQRLPPEIQQLFPDRFVLTEEMGWVPEGWEVKTIGDVVETTGGGTPSTKNPDFWEGGVHPFCTPKDMSQLTSWVLMDTERHLTDDGVNKISSGQLPKGTVLMSSRAPIGYLAISDVPVSVNQGVIALLPNTVFGPLYLLNWLHANLGVIMDRANGSTFLEISKKNFRPIPFLIPSNDVAKAFNEQAKAIQQKLLLLAEETVSLTNLRDSLLPKLLSGQITIPDAEQQLAEVL